MGALRDKLRVVWREIKIIFGGKECVIQEVWWDLDKIKGRICGTLRVQITEVLRESEGLGGN